MSFGSLHRPEKQERTTPSQLNDGQVGCVIADMKPHRPCDEAINACIRYTEANRNWMRCDVCRSQVFGCRAGTDPS